MNNNDKQIPTISIKKIEKNISKTYTDTESNIKIIEKIAEKTYRSFNDILKEIVYNFIQNGRVYDPCKNKYYGIDEIMEQKNNDGEEKEGDNSEEKIE